MTVQVNGSPREMTPGTMLDDLLRTEGTPERGVAVAVNGAVVPRARWTETPVPDGAIIEIRTAVQGG